MATNLALDDQLIEQAVKIGKHKTKREAVTTALQEYVKSKKRIGILDMFGKVDFRPDWDHKTARRRNGKRIPKA
jgi:Arc/MetJ family transcription regulator